jgi:Uncharacterized protein, involved in the regulation of septum location
MPRRTTTPAEEHTTIYEETAGVHTETSGQSAATEQGQPEAAAVPLKLDVRITGTKNTYGNPTRATATVTLNDSFVINGFRVVMGENGLFCAMPARRMKNQEYVEVCHPITADFSRTLQASVLGEYRVHLAQQMEESQQVPDVYEPEGHEEPEPEMGM